MNNFIHEDIMDSINNPKWDFRTLDGIERDTKLPRDVILDFIVEHPELIRCALVPDSDGNTLYTNRNKKFSLREIFCFIRVYATKSIK